MLPTRSPAALRTASSMATTLPLPLVPVISAPCSRRSGLSSSARIAAIRSSPRLMPKRPRDRSAAIAAA